MDICAYPAKKITVGEYKQGQYACGDELKKIMVMGEMGTGKSTLLNAIINYLSGVEMEDKFRLHLEENAIIPNTGIRGYYIERTRLSFDIIVWDTPGLSDCERDRNLTQQINELITLEDGCHAICFVVKDTTTNIQKYIIDRMLLFFGREVTQNLYVLVTFSGGKSPKVLGELQNKGFPLDGGKCFAFNNVDLFTVATQATQSLQTPWVNTMYGIEQLFNTLSTQTHTSFTTSKYVIEKRKELQNKMNEITKALGHVRKTNKKIFENKELLEGYKVEAERTKDFCTKVIVQHKIQIPSDDINTFCTNCLYTCHESCGFTDSDKASCCAMTDGYCTACPGKCRWNWHKNNFFTYEYRYEETENINQYMKKEHENALEMILECEEEEKSLVEGQKKLKDELKGSLGEIKVQMNCLRGRALLCQSTVMSQCYDAVAEREMQDRNEERALEYENFAKQEQIKMNCNTLTEETIMMYVESRVEEYFNPKNN